MHRASSERPAGPHVFVVDDSSDTRELLTEALEMMGYKVTAASDGPSALAVAEAVRPDIAVLDIGLPGMNGYQLADALRILPTWQGVKLIAVTGFSRPEDRAAASQAGFAAHLVKPVGLAQLRETLDHVLAASSVDPRLNVVSAVERLDNA